MSPATLHAVRHPKAHGAAGRCIGQTDLHVDPRRAKRLAHRVRALARAAGLPRVIVTSPLRRSVAVGAWLRRWGWRHRIDAALSELDFGHWDGRSWADIPRAEVDAWCADFPAHAPGGGESVCALLHRVRGFAPQGARVVITHGGWMSAATWLAQARNESPTPEHWPPAPRHGQVLALPWPLAGADRPGRLDDRP